MFQRILMTALLSGLIAGVGISIVQHFTTTPLIIHAEEYEGGSAGGGHAHGEALVEAHSHANAHTNAHAHSHDAAAADAAEPWAPEDGLERTFFTSVANVQAGVGFALILVAALAIAGKPVTGRIGVLWGLAGFAIFILAPALGLPPEAPGALASELGGRQIWWALCAGSTAAGLWMLVFRPKILWTLGGIVLLAAPHIVGAPQPESIGGAVPPELAAHFAAASIVTACVFWCALGWVSGTLWRRFDRT